MDTPAIEGSGNCEAVASMWPRNWDQIKVPGEGSECQDILDGIAQCLLSNSQLTASSDEKSLMARINSLCCLLQKDLASTQIFQISEESCFEECDLGKGILQNHANELLQDNKSRTDVKGTEGNVKDVSGSKQASGMSRKDSFGELLLHFPCITSLPKF